MPDVAVLSIDDSDGFAYIISRWLQAERRIHHLAHIGSAAAVYEMVALLRPRVVVLDFHAPGAEGLEEMRRTLRAFPETRFVVMVGEPSEAEAALRAGAAAVVDKDYGRVELAPAILRVAEGVLAPAPEPKPAQMQPWALHAS